MTTLAQAIAAATVAAAATTKNRALAGVYVTTEAVYGTDSHRLVRAAYTGMTMYAADHAAPGIFVPLHIAKQVKGTATVTGLDDTSLTLADGTTLSWAPVDTTYPYPQVDRLFPDSPQMPTDAPLLNPAYLADVAKIATAINAKRNGIPVKMLGHTDGDPNKPALFALGEDVSYLVCTIREVK